MLMNLRGSYVLNMTEMPNRRLSPTITQLMCPLLDSDEANIACYFAECFDFIQRAIHDDSNVLIHCERGVRYVPCSWQRDSRQATNMEWR